MMKKSYLWSLLVIFTLLNSHVINAEEGYNPNTTEGFEDAPDESNQDGDDSCGCKCGPQLDFEIHVDPCVYEDYTWDEAVPGSDCEAALNCGLIGVWFPEAPPLFRPFLADPRQICMSAGWRFNDQALTKNVIDVSFGDYFPIYRWCDIWCMRGDLEVAIEGALWAVFDPLHQSAPLINADYYGGMTISYAWDNWALRLRGFHISTHIGDEFLLEHPHFHRRNPSTEFLDLYVSNQLTREIRLYAGLGWLACQDDSFRMGPWYAEAGMELRLYQLGFIDYCNRLYGEPFFAMDFKYNNSYKHHLDSTYVLGYEWGKLSGLRRRVRIYIEYHDGYSPDGQFCKTPTNYLSIRASYGY